MNEKKYSKLLSDTLSDKYIDEAADAEKFFALKKAAAIRRSRMLKMFSTAAACLLLVVSLSVSAIFLIPPSDQSVDGDNKGQTDGDSPNYDFDDDDFDGDFWGDDDPIDWGDEGGDDVCIACVDENGDLKCDVCGSDVENSYDPWDGVGHLAVPNTAATISLIKIADRLGSFNSSNGFISATDMAIAEITNVRLLKGSAVSIEYDYTGASSSSGVLLGVNADESATTWRANTSAIFVYIANDGTARIAKISSVGITDVAVSPSPVYSSGATAKVIASWDGANTVSVKVDNAVAVTANVTLADAGFALGLRAGAAGVKYENVRISLSGKALELETRFGNNWEIIEDGEHDGALYAGYDGESALTDKSLALIGNIDFTGAGKITLKANVAIGSDWRTTTENGKTGNQSYGFILNVYNNDKISPIFWEDTKYCSYFNVYMSGKDAEGAIGKFGQTTFEKDYYNNGGDWYGLPGSTTKIPTDESGNPVDDGIPDECTITNGTVKTTFAYGKYNELKVEWDKENLTLTGWIDGQEFRRIVFTENPFAIDGDGVGLRTNSGDIYFANISVTVE